MGRKIEVTITNHFEFDEDFLREHFPLAGEALSDNDILDLAEDLVNNMDSETILDTAYVEAVFYE